MQCTAPVTQVVRADVATPDMQAWSEAAASRGPSWAAGKARCACTVSQNAPSLLLSDTCARRLRPSWKRLRCRPWMCSHSRQMALRCGQLLLLSVTLQTTLAEAGSWMQAFADVDDLLMNDLPFEDDCLTRLLEEEVTNSSSAVSLKDASQAASTDGMR